MHLPKASHPSANLHCALAVLHPEASVVVEGEGLEMSLLCILQHLLQLSRALQLLYVIDGAEALSWAQNSTLCILVSPREYEGRCSRGRHLISSPVSQ